MELIGVIAQSIFDDNAADLKFSWVAGLKDANRAFDVDFAKEAMSAANLVGHLNLIHPNRTQVPGKPEIICYQRLSEENRKRQMGELILPELPFPVTADGVDPLPDLELRCMRSSTPLFMSPISLAVVIGHLRPYLSRISAPRVTMHGVFLDILGMDVLIMGDSGLGKNELGLELISRGHGLVADDAADFVRSGSDLIEGRCPPLLQNLLGMCGLGLLDIRMTFGETAVRWKMKIKLIAQLVRRNDSEFERLPLDSQYLDVLGLPTHMVKTQVAAGCNSAVLVEAVVHNTILRLRGIDTLRNFIDRQRAAIQAEAVSYSSQGRLL